MKRSILLCLPALLLCGQAAYAGYTFESFDDALATTGTRPYGIYNGVIVGDYSNSLGYHGFIRTGNTIVSRDKSGATDTYFTGIENDTVVGYFHDGTGTHGLTYSQSGFTYTTISTPSPFATFINSISSGLMAGTYNDGASHGYTLTSGNLLTTIDGPGATATFVYGISGATAVGYYHTASGDQGFEETGGIFTSIDVPGSVPHSTQPQGIRGSNIVGYASMAGVMTGFVKSGSTYTTVSYPGAIGTAVTGIDFDGTITGYFIDTNGTHGFVATPTAAPVPEPASLTLLALGIPLAVRRARRSC